MCYLDESGVQENTGTQYFVLSGLAIPDKQWKALEQQVNNCKRRYGLENVEIHTAWLARRFVEQEQVRDFERLSWIDRRAAVRVRRDAALIKVAARSKASQLKEAKKNYRKTEPYVHLTFGERRALLVELADLVGSWQDARLFAEVIDKAHVYSSAAHPYTPFEFAFRELIQRYEYFLLHRGRAIGQTLYGIVIQDNNETMARRLTDMMRMIHEKGTKWTNVDHIIETPLFVDSHLTSMVQMSDICAYAIRRFFENSETDLFNRIHARFDRAGSAVVGIRHYTVDGCRCRVCADHS
jgi:hypothetical protein